jgi:hypothetical protein
MTIVLTIVLHEIRKIQIIQIGQQLLNLDKVWIFLNPTENPTQTKSKIYIYIDITHTYKYYSLFFC